MWIAIHNYSRQFPRVYDRYACIKEAQRDGKQANGLRIIHRRRATQERRDGSQARGLGLQGDAAPSHTILLDLDTARKARDERRFLAL